MNETRFERLTWLLLSFFAYALLFMARGQSCSVPSDYPGGIPDARASAQSGLHQTDTMHLFIHETARSLGEEEPVVRAATAAMLRSIQFQLSELDFDLISRRIPGVQSLLLEECPGVVAEHGCPCVGSLPRSLHCAGLDGDRAVRFTSRFVGFLRREGGERVVLSVLRDLPELDAAG